MAKGRAILVLVFLGVFTALASALAVVVHYERWRYRDLLAEAAADPGPHRIMLAAGALERTSAIGWTITAVMLLGGWWWLWRRAAVRHPVVSVRVLPFILLAATASLAWRSFDQFSLM